MLQTTPQPPAPLSRPALAADRPVSLSALESRRQAAVDLTACFAEFDRNAENAFGALPGGRRFRGGLLGRLASAQARLVDRGATRVAERLFLASDPPDCSGDVEARIRWHRDLYGAPELLAEPNRFFRPPQMPRHVQVRRISRLRDGQRIEAEFLSTYKTFDPDYQFSYDQFSGNETVRVQLWQHRQPRRPTVLCVNPWCCGYFAVDRHLFDVRRFYRRGYNVALFALPFHGHRTPAQALYPGQLFPNRELRRTNEGFGQAVCDLRVVRRWLVDEADCGPVGLLGMSLGGYAAALMAALEPNLPFAVVLMAPSSMADGLWLHGATSPAKLEAEAAGFTLDRFRHIWAIHTPVVLPLRTPRHRVLQVWGEGDRLIPAVHQRALWRHLGEPEAFSFAGGHLLQASWPVTMKRIRRWIDRAL